MSGFHLAQLNIAILREPLDSPLLSDFVEALEPINQLADESDGFVWRLQTEDGDATGIRAFDDDRFIVNMSVWESVEPLRRFVFKTAHTDVLRKRKKWFEQMAEAYTVMWWVPAGHEPTLEEAESRLRHLRAHGPTEHAFTFKQPFPAPTDIPVQQNRL